MSVSGIVVAGVACIICLALVGAGITMRNRSLKVDQDEEGDSPQQNIFLEACDFRRKEAALKEQQAQKEGKGNGNNNNNKDSKDSKDSKDGKDAKDAKGKDAKDAKANKDVKDVKNKDSKAER